MNSEEILRQIEEIEARAATQISSLQVWDRAKWRPVGYLGPARDVPWLCGLARKLLAVAEAARKVWDAASEDVKEDMWFEMPPDWEGWEELEKALAALKEENDGDL